MEELIQKTNSIMQDKSKFITDILDYSIKKKIDDKTKERLVNLISKEFEKTGIVETEIIEKLSKIEKWLYGDDKTQKKENSFHGKQPRPQETKNFLSLFNNSEGLKYLTHKFNDGKRDYNSFMDLCKKEFEENKQKYKNVPEALLKRIKEFAFSENPKWFIREGNDKTFYKKGWSEKSFIEWYKNKINIHPVLESKWNNDMISPFKDTIEVKAGKLTEIIDKSIELALGKSKSNFKIDKNNEELNLAEFYTDVDKFKSAIFNIISTIKDMAYNNLCFKIKIRYNNQTIEGGHFKIITITHINSIATKLSNDPEFIKGDLKAIQSILYGLCNFEIEAKFPDGLKNRILLTDDSKDYKDLVQKNKSTDIKSEVVEGFSYILKFY